MDSWLNVNRVNKYSLSIICQPVCHHSDGMGISRLFVCKQSISSTVGGNHI